MADLPDSAALSVRPRERIAAVDAVRGFALLGILVPNMLAFAVPLEPATLKPALEATTANDAAMLVHDVFFFGKFMFLFAMLFGAGVVLFDRPAAAGEPSRRRLWLVRCVWLGVFGLAHGLLIWFGDILLLYAVAGLVAAWWVRAWPLAVLFPASVVVYGVGVLAFTGLVALSGMADGGDGAGDPLGVPVAEQLELVRRGYFGAASVRLSFLWVFIVLIPFVFGWYAAGLMMLGVALARAGFLTGRLPSWAYAATAAVGLAVGLPLTFWLHQQHPRVFDTLFQPVGAPTALGYASVVILVTRSAALRPVAAALAAVGRMAFSNYILHSVLGLLVFSGFGLGLFGRVEFPGLWLIIAAFWAVNIAGSLLWLRRFEMGPLERGWRWLVRATAGGGSAVDRDPGRPGAGPPAPPTTLPAP